MKAVGKLHGFKYENSNLLIDMQGAREYADLFKTGQYGKLYIVSGFHGRGRTFRIQVLPGNEAAIPNGPNNTCLNKDAVEVYGVLGGHLGWTEYYGWKHYGPWQRDFYKLVNERKAQIQAERLSRFKREKEVAEKEQLRIKELLLEY